MPQGGPSKSAYYHVMKTWSLTSILTSAYLSAMLTSGLAPINPKVIFAAAVDPMAAQRVMQAAVSALSADGWSVGNVALPPAPQVVAKAQPPKADPVMTDELMARLLAFAATQDETTTIGKDICRTLKVCDGTADLVVRQLGTEFPKGLFFNIPTAAGSKDIIIIRRNADDSLDCYLTDKSYKLRSAAHVDTNVVIVPNEKAAKEFKIALSHLAREAADLPPTGAAVAGNS